MIKTNKDKIVMRSVGGKIHSPIISNPYRIDRNGIGKIVPATGGITYNYQIGDNCMELVGDHVEPGVSIKNQNDMENRALMVLSCIGNTAIIKSGDAKGAKGFVTGSHGGIDHTLIYFNKEILDKLDLDDKILIKAYGQGLEIEGYEDIICMNIDPLLLENIGIKEINGQLEVPVVTEIPAFMMGSGIGSATAFEGDYDIMTGDIEAVKKYGIDKLKFGDIVLLKDCDNTYGRDYLKGAVSIGVIVHSNCIKSGHGPGVTTILSSKTSKLIGRIDKNSNIKHYLNIV